MLTTASYTEWLWYEGLTYKGITGALNGMDMESEHCRELSCDISGKEIDTIYGVLFFFKTALTFCNDLGIGDATSSFAVCILESNRGRCALNMAFYSWVYH